MELQSWLTQSIELTCSRTFRCLNMCHALCFLVYVDSTDLVSQTLPVVFVQTRAPATRLDRGLDLPRPHLARGRPHAGPHGPAPVLCYSLFVWKCEVAARRCPVAGALRVSVCVVRVCRPELTFSQSWSVPCVSIHKGRFN